LSQRLERTSDPGRLSATSGLPLLCLERPQDTAGRKATQPFAATLMMRCGEAMP